MPKKRAKTKPKLPPYVVLKFDPPEWHCRRVFPLPYRDEKNRIVYQQISRRCVPETAERAAEISAAIERAWKNAKPPETPLTFAAFVMEFIRAKQQSLRKRTYDDYTAIYERYIKGTTFAASPSASVDPLTIQRFYTQLAERGVSAKMIRRVNTLVSMSFNQAMRWGTVTRNPTHGVILPRVEHTEIEIMTRDQARAFAAVCMADDRFLVLALALETGMRPEEYLALRWSDFSDLESLEPGWTVTVRRAVSFPRGGGHEFGDVKTPKSRRTIEISSTLRDRLVIHRDVLAEERAKLEKTLHKPLTMWPWKDRHGPNYQKRKASRRRTRDVLAWLDEYDLVFPATSGGPRNPRSVGRIEMKEACEKAGIAAHSLYSLRHSCATLSLAAGGDIKTISEKLGHAGIRITLDTYAHVLPVMRGAVTAKIAEALY